MRYYNIDTIEFIDADGNSYPIKDDRDIPKYITQTKLKVTSDIDIDEVASRPEVYGKKSEYLAYAIIEHNIVNIVNRSYSTEKLRELKIPVL